MLHPILCPVFKHPRRTRTLLSALAAVVTPGVVERRDVSEVVEYSLVGTLIFRIPILRKSVHKLGSMLYCAFDIHRTNYRPVPQSESWFSRDKQTTVR
jgi:hypothetical protein